MTTDIRGNCKHCGQRVSSSGGCNCTHAGVNPPYKLLNDQRIYANTVPAFSYIDRTQTGIGSQVPKTDKTKRALDIAREYAQRTGDGYSQIIKILEET